MKLKANIKSISAKNKFASKALLSSLFLLISSLSSHSQSIVNAYAKVSAINGARTILTLTNVDQTNHTFSAGSKIVVLQMQANVIGSDTSDNSSFGTVSSIGNAGRYEFATISSLTPSSGTPTSITLTSSLYYTYTTDANSSVQIVSFRNFGTDYTTTSNITGLAWNGNIGGVIAIEVNNKFTLNHNISADGIGFRGGSTSSNYYDGSTTCIGTVYKSNDNLRSGYKGEGIYATSTSTLLLGRAKLATGGGGGGYINCGGGGGGNYSEGGRGGLGWSCNSSTSGAGLGGAALSTHISASRIFMGGGGGGGQQNNSAASAGGRGGGIILIKATTIETNTICSGGITISANGNSASSSGNDGAGGGGAAGSTIIQATTFSASSTCPLLVRANGGAGGNCTDGGSHAGGGGGSQGVVIYSTTQPTTNVTTSAANGSAGIDNNGGSVTGTTPPAPNNSGIDDEAPTTLPIELISFKTRYIKETKYIKIDWSTASQTNNDYFTIEKSINAYEWKELKIIPGAGTNTQIINYSIFDENPYNGINYYRLKQTDFNGLFEYSNIQSVNIDEKKEYAISILPNPTKGKIKITSNNFEFDNIQILNLLGKPVFEYQLTSPVFEQDLDLSELKAGIYIASIKTDQSIICKKFVVNSND